MKIRLLRPYLLFFWVMVFGACETEEELPHEIESKLLLELVQTFAGAEGSRMQQVPIQGVSNLVLTIEEENGAATDYSFKSIPVLSFENRLIIEELTLSPGKYQITDFHLSDSLGSILYASPLAGSPFGEILNQPLPLSFQLRAAASEAIQVEVISTAGASPEKFGFQPDMEGFRETFFFFLTLTGEKIDEYLDFLPGKLNVSTETFNMNFSLDRNLNRIVLPKETTPYLFQVESVNYQPLKISLGYDSVSQFDQKPLVLELIKKQDEEAYIGGSFEGMVFLSTQTQVDSFARKGYESIQGNLTISHTSMDDADPVKDLSGLNSLQSINGDFTLSDNPLLTSVLGLQNLLEISGKLTIQNNARLESLTDFFRLRYVPRINLIKNPNLRNFEGLGTSTPSLKYLHIEGMDHFESLNALGKFGSLHSLTIKANPQLTQINFNLPEQKSIPSLTVTDNPELQHFGYAENWGFDRISSLVLVNNEKLEDLKGLLSPEGIIGNRIELVNHPKIKTLQDLTFHEFFSRINIRDNESLEDLIPFTPLTVLFSRLILENNPKIKSLQGLHNISEVVYTEIPQSDNHPFPNPIPVLFKIRDNATLTDFCAFADQITLFEPAFSEIENNGFNPTHEDLRNGVCKE
ncbi:hypothetical protein [Cyclobacterium plantarum]|uniref:Uncharacterized protein n=1 Tax=Cyclobacterium plantarum TaxID=2716263 RepID=A0ABX0H2T0_9BACT|nr:hypothetical protein [Cyclobacterium plantarum]NHE55750.1 hypothetical protein [Cyclobacterium plantarum]